MRLIENQEFRHGAFRDRSTAAIYTEFDLRRCYFEGVSVSFTDDPLLRSTVRNGRLIDCSQRGCRIHSPIVEDVIVEGFKTNGQLLRSSGAVFNRVVLRGKIDPLLISNDVSPSILIDEGERTCRIKVFREANADYYRRVDWALDISKGEFKDLDIRGVPGHLIVRDPETQVVVTREKALEGRWRELDFNETLWRTSIQNFLGRDEPDVVLVAPKRHRKFPLYVEDLRLLQKAGVAEPN